MTMGATKVTADSAWLRIVDCLGEMNRFRMETGLTNESKRSCAMLSRTIMLLLAMLLAGSLACADNSIKEGGREVGQGVTKAAKATGKAIKKSGKATGKAFKKAGKATGTAFKESGKETGEAFKEK
jgi:hypothetical protein